MVAPPPVVMDAFREATGGNHLPEYHGGVVTCCPAHQLAQKREWRGRAVPGSSSAVAGR